MCTYRYTIKEAARMLRDETNKSRFQWDYVKGIRIEIKRKRHDRITLADAEAYIRDIRDIHERMEQWRKDHPKEHYPTELFYWPRSHARTLYTRRDGTTYCRMLECENDLKLNIPLTA